MKKRIISILLVVSMLVSVLPIPASAVNDNAVTAGAAESVAKNPFTDIKSGDWFYDAVQYARVNGFFSGTSDNTFDPNGTMTRGMFVTVLGRMAGIDPSKYAGEAGFTDVAADAWYAPYVGWAAKYGITGGMGDGNFSPNANITREQMAAFYVRYFEAFDINYDTGANITTVPADLDNVSDWAKDAVLKLWKTGLLNGDGRSFNPASNATRAEAAALSQRTDAAVETWYSEPGVPSERVSVGLDGGEAGEQKPEEQKPGGGSSGGGTTTTYYEVQFAMVDGQSGDGVTLPETKAYASGTKISAIPTPYKQNGIFMGWYYDAAMAKAVGAGDTLTRNMTLYAKMGEITAVSEQETPNYVTVSVAAEDTAAYSFGIFGYTDGCVTSFTQITSANAAVQFSMNGTTVVVKDGYTPGQTYRVELDEDAAAQFIVNGVTQDKSIRVLNIITEKGEVQNLKLDGDMKYIPAASVSNMTGTAFDGLFSVSVSTQNSYGVTQNKNVGTFTYTGSDIAVGNTVAIYSGTRPDLRSKDTLGTSADGAVIYVEITAKNGTSYSYKTAESEDVLFTPDVLPVSTAADTDGDSGNQSITVPADVMDFSSDKYAAMGLDSQTTVDKGDFIAFYNGASLNESSTKAGYGIITNVTKDGSNYVITYADAAETDVLAAMDLYNTRNEQIELTEAEKAAIEADMEKKALDSGFVEEAATYLTALALETDGFQELSNDMDMDLTSYSVTFANGTPLKKGDISLMSGSKVEVTKKEISATIAAGKVLQHFAGSYGIRAELAMTFTVEIDGKIEITLQAIFEQEVLLSINTSGGAEWRWAWIIPYIYDYNLNANIDLGTFTGIGITATAKTIGTEDDDEYNWKPVSGKAGEAKLIDIGKQITELMELKDEFLGEKMVDENGEEIEWAGTNGGGLAEKYASFMENANESWIEIFRTEIFAQEGFVDLFHILCYGVSADFVVKANLYATMGMTFEYGVAKRYNFSLKLFHKVSSNETIDLEEAHYNFDFYVMGTAGIRAGIELEVAVGLFSLKLDSIGICAEVGAYAQMWGYFYYHLGWTKSGGKESSYSGAMAIEIGLYLTISFKAQLFSSKKLTYQPTLYDKQWPLLTIGQVENVYDFAYENNVPSLRMKIMSAKEFSISPDLFAMNYMDLKSGEIFGSDAEDAEENPPKIYDDASESHFTIAMSNPKFHYHPNTNTITVDGDADLQEKCEMTITWKRGALAFTSRPIVRTLSIEWSDPVNARYINFDTAGGSVVAMISDNTGRKITRPNDPTKVGYIFGGWYTNSGLTNAFNFPDTMPDYPNKGITVNAKWIPRTDTKYTVEHYLQELNGTYTLKETEGKTGTTKTQTNAAAKTGGDYANYEAKPFAQTTIEPDGSAVVKVYYQRKTYTVEFTFGTLADGSDNTAPLTYSAKYGSVVYAPTMALGGYDFNGYQGLTPDSNGGVTVTGAASYSARWTPRDDTPYRIEHYIQRTDGAGYILPGDNAIISDYGTTGSSININAKKLTDTGLSYVGATVNGITVTAPTIGADGKTVVKLYYDRNSYNLTFMDGSTTYKTEQTRFGKTLQAPTAPTKDGYTFAGWYRDSACSVGSEFDFTDAAMPASDLTLYAKWNAGERTYTVNHYLMGTNGQYAIESVDSNQSAKTGDVLTLSDLAKTTYGDGITYDHATVGDSTETTYTIPASGTVTVNLYYSRAQYDLTWNLAGGTATNSYTNTGKVYWGASITAPVLTKAGYTYEWDVTPASAMPAGNVTYTAVWTANTDTPYKVEYYQQKLDGTYSTEADITYNLTGRTDDPITAEAETITGFTYDNAASTKTGAIAGNGSTVLKLYYTRNSYTLTWNINGGTVTAAGTAAGSVLYGAALTAPTLEKAGYTLSWNPTVPAAMPAANSTYEAVWTANDDTAYKVEHYQQNADDNGYTLFETENLSGTTAAAVTAAAKTTGGYEHFTENTTHTSRVPSGTIAGDGSTVLKLYYDRDTVSVTFNANGGTLTDSANKTFKYGQTFSVTDPTRTDYAFNGWYNGESKYTASTVTETENFTLTAHWTAGAINYTVEHYIMGVDGSYPSTPTHSNTENGIVDSSITLSTLKNSSYEAADGIVYKVAKVGTDVKTSTALVKNMTVKLYYERKAYTLGWEIGSGTITNPTAYTKAGTVYYGAAITAPTLAKTGHTYAWNVTPATMPAHDVTCTASWTANTYYVAFNKNGGSGNMDNQTFTYGTAQALTANGFTSTGRSFAGWATTADGAKAYDNEQEVSDLTAENKATVTLYAKWTANSYDVTLNLNGGSITGGNVENYTYGTGATLPTPSKTNYAFGGWYTNSTFDGSSVTAIGTTETGGKEFWAKWTPIEYSISYSGTDSGTNRTKYTVETDDFTLINPTRVGYTFTGWTGTGLSSITEAVTVTKGSTGDRSYTANWMANNYTVALTLNSGSLTTNTIVLGGQNRTISTIDGVSTFEYHYGESAALPEPTRTGYTFGGWYATSDFSGEKVTLLSASDIGDKTFFAKWTLIEYTIIYNLNSGNVSGNPTKYTVETDSFTLKNPTRTYYTFDGWSGTDLAGNSNPVTVEKGSTGNRSYTANWTPISYTITYNLDGGTNSPSNHASYTVETESFTLATPTKAGHTFDGWYNNATRVTSIAKGSVGNLTLEAKWTVNSYTVTWNANGGNGLTGGYTTTAKYGTAIAAPTSPTRDATVEYSYTFDGWYTAQTGGTKVTDFGTLTDNVTYYAHWTQTKRSYTITWNPENGSSAQTTSLEYGAFILANQPTVTKSTTEVGKEYTLDGWYTEAEGGTMLSADVAVTGDAAYYAHWTLGDKKFTVTFNSDGGSSVPSQTVIYGNRFDKPSNPTKNGYEFMGWYSNSYTLWNFNTQPTSSITLTARWGIIYNVSTYAQLVDAADKGGAIYLTKNIVLEDEVIFRQDAVVHGQGYTISGKEANTATTGTPGFAVYSRNVTMDNLIFSGLRGAIKFDISSYNTNMLTLDNVTIQNCVKRYDNGDGTGSGYGAAISTNGSGKSIVVLRNCTLMNNEANAGGAIYLWSDASLELTDCILTGNKASSGGAMRISNSTATITGCTFSGNSAPFTTAGSGGDHIIYYRTTITLNECTFDGLLKTESFPYDTGERRINTNYVMFP